MAKAVRCDICGEVFEGRDACALMARVFTVDNRRDAFVKLKVSWAAGLDGENAYIPDICMKCGRGIVMERLKKAFEKE